MTDTLYARLGGYDAIAAVADDLLVRLVADAQLGRFWQNRAETACAEKSNSDQLPVASAGGPLYYVGRDMKMSHRGMGVSASDWQVFIGHLEATLEKFDVATAERTAVLELVDSTKAEHRRVGSFIYLYIEILSLGRSAWP